MHRRQTWQGLDSKAYIMTAMTAVTTVTAVAVVKAVTVVTMTVVAAAMGASSNWMNIYCPALARVGFP